MVTIPSKFRLYTVYGRALPAVEQVGIPVNAFLNCVLWLETVPVPARVFFPPAGPHRFQFPPVPDRHGIESNRVKTGPLPACLSAPPHYIRLLHVPIVGCNIISRADESTPSGTLGTQNHPLANGQRCAYLPRLGARERGRYFAQ